MDTPKYEVRMTSDSHFGWIRTRLSLERTLMAWVRTAAALIGFGFTIVQFFQRLSDVEGVRPALHPELPHYLGLALILAGILALVVALWQYRWIVGYLRNRDFLPLAGAEGGPVKSPVFAVAVVLLLIGIVAFGSVLFRLA
jgi:putative membrane protein